MDGREEGGCLFMMMSENGSVCVLGMSCLRELLGKRIVSLLIVCEK